MNSIAERVAAGAAFLDEHDPDWWRADVERSIDLARLDLEYGEVCILGQRCPVEKLALAVGCPPEEVAESDSELGYVVYARHLSGLYRRPEVTDWALPLGFVAAHDDDYRDLTAQWKRVITERRAVS